MDLKCITDNIIPIASLIISVVSVRFSVNANKIAKEANILSKKANELSEEQNRLSEESINLNLQEGISEFDIELQSIEFFNDHGREDSIEKAINGGTAFCKFKIKNRTDINAYKVGFESHEYGVRSEVQELNQNDEKEFSTVIELISLQNREPVYNIKYLDNLYKKHYIYESKLFWENKHRKCSCTLFFEIELKQIRKGDFINVEIATTGNKTVKTQDYRSN